MPQSENQAELCAVPIIHHAAVEAALHDAPAGQLVQAASELFKVFGDPGRLRILAALGGSELCVCDICAVLGASQSAVSHQLALLRSAGLVRNRKDGKIVYYSLADEHVGAILAIGLEHASERRKATVS